MQFEYRIENYTISDIEEMFGLSGVYDEFQIEYQYNLVNTKLESSRKKSPELMNLLVCAKEKLIEHKKNNEKNIIPKNTTSYANSEPSEFYAGKLNPLNKRIIKQNVNIDTRFRENYYATSSTNFNVELPIRLTDVVSLQLSSIELTNTFYVISQSFGNNYFQLSIPGVEPLMVIIPDGNYDYLAFQEYLNNYVQKYDFYKNIQFISDANTPYGTGPKGGTGKMIIGLIENATIDTFTVNFLTDVKGNEDKLTPLPLKCGWLMGFRTGIYENNRIYISEGIVNLQGSKYLYLVVDDFNNNVSDSFYGAFTSSLLNKNILARISLQGNIFNQITQDYLSIITSPRQYFGPVDIQKLHIQLLDEYGRIVNLNNMDYSFCLTFQTIYNL